jgi:hypothetical protein
MGVRRKRYDLAMRQASNGVSFAWTSSTEWVS